MASRVHVDIGGEGRSGGAINLNPRATTTTGIGVPAGSPIPNHVLGTGSVMPFPAHYADVITCENTPLLPGTAAEIARVIKPGGRIRLFHPTTNSTPYGNRAHADVVHAVGGKWYTYNSPDGYTTTLIIAPP
jgi:hypothetical protein